MDIKKIGEIKGIKEILFAVVITLIGGGISGLITSKSMEIYNSIEKPPLAPPGWLFPIIWTILFILMGIAAGIVLSADINLEEKRKSLTLYAIQLLVNIIWPVLFFNLDLKFISLIWILILWYLILLTIQNFQKIDKTASRLLYLYLIWVTFAAYLNLAYLII